MSGILLKFRSDLEALSSRNAKGDAIFIINDPITGKIYELGEEEYYLCGRFDGESSLEAIQQWVQEDLGYEIALDNIAAFARYLQDEGLFESEQVIKDGASTPDKTAGRMRIGVSLGNPDRLFQWLASRFGWIANRAVLFFTFALIAAAVAVLFLDGRVWLIALGNYWHTWLPVLFVFVFVILVAGLKELVRGVALAHFGGHVPEVELQFRLFLIPRFIIDSQQLRFIQDKSKQLWVIFVSGYTVLLLWAGSLIVWKLTHLGTYPNLFFWVLSLVAGIWSLLFVWNPLRTSEAYQLLSIWAEVPEFQPRAWRVAKAWLLRQTLPEPLSKVERKAFVWYGILSALWLVFLILALSLIVWGWLTDHFAGSGALIFILFVGFLISRLRSKQKKTVTERQEEASIKAFFKRLVRIVFSVKVLLLVVLVLVSLIPISYRVGGKFELHPQQRISVTSEIDGVIEKITVVEGDVIGKGEALAQLFALDYRRNVDVAMAKLREAEAELVLLLAGAKPEQVAEAAQKVGEHKVKLKYSGMRLKRLDKLQQQGLTSEQSYEDAEGARNIDQEELASAKAHLTLVKSGARDEQIKVQEEKIHWLKDEYDYAVERLKKTKLRSKIAGVITTPRVHELVGKRLEPGDELAVVEGSAMDAEVLLLEDDVGLVNKNKEVSLTFWAYPKEVFSGKITKIAPLTDTSVDAETKVVSKTVRLVVEVSNEDGRLKSGMTGYAKIDVGEHAFGWVFVRRVANWLNVEFWAWLPV